MKWFIGFCAVDLFYGHLFGVIHKYKPDWIEAYFKAKDELYDEIEKKFKKN